MSDSTPENSTKALGDMFAAKYVEARANGATDAQAVQACRLLWLEALGLDPAEVWK
jgi:hypothetical protein